MSVIYEALLRIQDLYKCKNSTETAKLLQMPKNTFYDNERKAEADYKKLQEIKTEKNPIKKELLQKSINSNKQKHYANALYHQIVELAIRDNLNLNWAFNGDLPIHNDSGEKIAKIVKNHNLKEFINDDSVAVPYFEEFKSANDQELEYIVLPKNMIKKAKSAHALKATDDSMSPNIKSNAVVIIDFAKKVLKKSSVYVGKYEDQIFIKRLEDLGDHILLRSDNIAYNTITAKKEEVEIIGQVINTISFENVD